MEDCKKDNIAEESCLNIRFSMFQTIKRHVGQPIEFPEILYQRNNRRTIKYVVFHS